MTNKMISDSSKLSYVRSGKSRRDKPKYRNVGCVGENVREVFHARENGFRFTPACPTLDFLRTLFF